MSAAKAPLRAAVVGCGPWGEAHMRALVAQERTELVAICGRSPGRVGTVAQKYGVRAYTNLEELIAKERIEFASIATGERDHFAPASTLIRGGIPILVEKPLTYELAQSKQLVDLATNAGVPCGVNFNMRYLMPFQLMRRALVGGELGRTVSFLWRFSHRWFPPADSAEPAVTITHHIHGLNLLLAFGGAVRSVQAASVPGQDGASHTTIGALLHFHSGALGVVAGGVDGALSNDVMTLEVQGVLGRAIARDATAEFSVSLLAEETDRVWRPFFADVDETNFQRSLDWHLAEFVAALEKGDTPPIPIEEGYDAQLLGWAIIAAAQSGGAVDVASLREPVALRQPMYTAPRVFRASHAGAGAEGYSGHHPPVGTT